MLSVRVLISDPNSIVTAGLGCLLEKQLGFEVVAKAPLGPAMLEHQVLPLFDQRRGAVPVKRVLPYNKIML